MIHDLKKAVIREGTALLGFCLIAGAWYVFFLLVAPFLSEVMARSTQDFSYLWDGSAGRMAAVARSGVFVLLCLAAVWLFLRVLRRTWQGIFRTGKKARIEGRRRTFGVVIAREIAVLAGVIVVCFGLFYFSHSRYVDLKEQYFNEVIVNKKEYRKLSGREKVLAHAQYERLHPRAAVEDLFRDYGWHARAVCYAQAGAAGALVWGYPFYVLARFLFWALKRLED